MYHVRISAPADIPAQRELWALAFGDSGAYVDNFYQTYFRPDRILVLETAGQVRAMTAWFDTTFVVPGCGEFRAAYLYAVATHPAFRGKGLAGHLLAGADDYFRTLGIPAVTTVPAQPSLHRFFAANGFQECFVLTEQAFSPEDLPSVGSPCLHPTTPEQYRALRAVLLADRPHISYPADALTYQQGCCLLSGGNLFAADTENGPILLCAEGAGNDTMVIKELLASPAARLQALADLPRIAPAQRWLVREPLSGEGGWPFAMLKWLDPDMAGTWDWSSTAYLGLAFD